MTTHILNGDGETRSLIDLTQVGTHIYAAHPSTKLLTFSYSFDAGKTMSRWRPWLGEKMPSDLADALHDRDVELQAWHASFERHIFRDVCGIDVPAERWHCTMVRSRSMALPGSLELCARALEMPVKKGDDTIMLKWCKLQKDGTWADDPAEFEQLCDYCDDDVRTEAGLASVLREFTPEERVDYAVNERKNDRGLFVDLSLAKAAQHYAKDELADICDRLNIISQGKITSPKQYQRIKAWLAERLPPELAFILDPDEKTGKVSFDAAAREEVLGPDYEDFLVGETRELVELVHDGGKASTSKFAAMQIRAGDDQRVRGAYNLFGAGQTKRYSSTGLQVHNYIRASLPNIEDVIEKILSKTSREDLIKTASFDAEDGGLAFIDRKRRERIRKPYNVLTILSRTLRPSIIAPPGKVLVWRDWSSIEARVLPWLSLENSASQVLEVFASGKDIYRHQAAMSFGVPAEETNDVQRQGGKIQILSFGFGGGAGAGMRMARAYGLDIDERTADGWKNAWRQTNPWAQRFWGKLEVAAFQAVRNPDTTYDAGRVSYLCTADILFCLLPCGTLLSYPFPKISSVPGRWGPADTVTAIKASLHPKKGTNYWPRMKLWGGLQAETCLGSDTEVLTSTGWRPIVQVTVDDLVWDGVEWVRQGGPIYRGVRDVINFGGVTMTPDHKVLTDDGWTNAEDTTHAAATATGERFDRPEVRALGGDSLRGSEAQEGSVGSSMRLRHGEESRGSGSLERKHEQLRLLAQRDAMPRAYPWHEQSSGLLGMAIDDGSLPPEIASRIQELWRTWDKGLRSLAQVRELLGRHGPNLRVGIDVRARDQLEGLLTEKLRLGGAHDPSAQPAIKPRYRHSEGTDAFVRSLRAQWDWSDDTGLSTRQGMVYVDALRSAEVYDLLNCGLRSCFTVRGSNLKPFIVHNCTQGEAASLLRWAERELDANGWPIVGDTHDEILLEVDEDEEEEAQAVMKDIMNNPPPAIFGGLPLASEGASGFSYGK